MDDLKMPTALRSVPTKATNNTSGVDELVTYECPYCQGKDPECQDCEGRGTLEG
jgi:hypothetical protein